MSSRYKQEGFVNPPDFEPTSPEDMANFVEASKNLWTIYVAHCTYCRSFLEVDESIKWGDKYKCPKCELFFKAYPRWVTDCEVEI